MRVILAVMFAVAAFGSMSLDASAQGAAKEKAPDKSSKGQMVLMCPQQSGGGKVNVQCGTGEKCCYHPLFDNGSCMPQAQACLGVVNPLPMFANQGAGTSIHGTEATIVVNRSGCWLIPNKGSKVEEAKWENDNAMRDMNVPHWKNWLECIKTRQKPISEIETCVRSSTACILANLSLRHKTWLDWDEANWTVKQPQIREFLKAKYRAPWKLEV